MTRLGDLGFLLGWLLAVATTGQTEIEAVLNAVQNREIGAALVTLMAFLILAGALGKSAQLPLTGWLPDAMIGPTPVSALIHSATMVAAGVFLVLRLYPLFAAAPAALVALAWIGAATALVGALVATAENDLKRVLAWSTSSHLGEMMLALGLGGPVAASFHLATHAAYKSTLFLAAGSVQEQTGTRDLDKLGGLIRALPVTGGVFLVAALALAGIPPLSGFWSEDAILRSAEHRESAAAAFVMLVVFLAGLYIGRATVAVFFGPRSDRHDVREPGGAMLAGMVLLTTAAALLGWLLNTRIEALLPFQQIAEAGHMLWSLVAVGVAVVGLALGAMRARAGAAPVLGSWSTKVGPSVIALTAAPARGVLRLADVIALAEQALDRAARWIASAVWNLARASNTVEAIGFGGGGDRFATVISFAGENLRAVQSGKVYLYTLGLFVWAAAALVAVSLVLWL